MSEVTFVNTSTVDNIAVMGGDYMVCNSARISFANDGVSRHDILTEADRGLIGFLMKNRHGTPFESTVFTFRIETPIFVAREWFRHRIGSFNEMSGRYTVLPMRFYMPNAARSQKGKPGAYSFEEETHLTPLVHESLRQVYVRAAYLYDEMLEAGVAKEQARLCLPTAIMTQFYWTVNARSLMNFLSLRLDKHAMQEIRDAALKVWDEFDAWMPVTANVFTEGRMTAP
jgi:thymidylate synthase (FAD)